MPLFTYFLSNQKNPVREDSRIWSAPIPLDRHPSVGLPQSETGGGIRYGDYFTAVRNFLEQDGFEIITHAVAQHTRRDITSEAIEKIRIILEKHGEFYHPARIETVLAETTLSFVLNVAVSDIGKRYANREFRFLKQLNTQFPFSFLPRVYGRGRIYTQSEKLEIRMFLGEWFEGFNEFHISIDPADEQHKIVVWDHEHGNYFLSTGQTEDLYRQAAGILTGYYNVETSEQISSWHHAAGDFVLKCQNREIDVKLITVRQYAPMFEKDPEIGNKDPDAEQILESLLVFFLNLAIKMRIDRLDGVGEIVWSGDIAVKGVLKGFFEGLVSKPPIRSFPGSLADGFRQHLSVCTHEDLRDLNAAMLQAYHPMAPEVPVIRQYLKQHVDDLYRAIEQFRKYS
ncbi:MAG: hypothetical protein JRF39_10540 [Deltaproteobacteria bacterium]|nr:hypothetical protein [Deltaproteobacteria bacterium]